MKLVECPICDSKFDIEKVPEGTKLKCGKCHKIFGVVKGSEMVPVSISRISKAVTAVKRPTVIAKRSSPQEDLESEEGSYEEEVAVSRTGSGVRRGYTEPRRGVRVRQEPPKPKPKLEPLLYVGALIAIGAIIAFFYVLNIVQNQFPSGSKDGGIKIETPKDKDSGKLPAAPKGKDKDSGKTPEVTKDKDKENK